MIIIDMVERDAKGNPSFRTVNKQYITNPREDSKFYLMIMEFNRTTIGEITTSVISRTATRTKSSIRR